MYQCPASQEPLLITSTDIETEMRSVAARVYKLDPIKDKEALQRWSSHSLRVGACVILHSMGITETQLKWLLRWRSDAFMVYLRNTAILANTQYETLDKASAMPHTEMRPVAARVYKLDPIKDKEALQRWSSHSLRVGACVILHSMGITETQLKWLLRWRSDAFMVYLRNTAILANTQYETLDKASAMPHFL